MTQYLVLTSEAFVRYIQQKKDEQQIAYYLSDLADEHVDHVMFDRYGDWVLIPETPDRKPGTFGLISDLVGNRPITVPGHLV